MSKFSSAIVENYSILPIIIPATKSYPKSATHYIYLRPHAPKFTAQDDARSLFLVNIPVDSTFAYIRSLFTALIGAGRVESVNFNNEEKKRIPEPATNKKLKKRKREVEGDGLDTTLPLLWNRPLLKSGSCAVVVLVDEQSVQRVLKKIKKLHKSASELSDGQKKRLFPIWGEGVLIDSDECDVDGGLPALGSARYLAHQKLQYPDVRTLQAGVEAYMAAFAAQELEQAAAAKRRRSIPDEDGFVTVVRGAARTGPARREDAERKKAELDEKEAKKRESMSDFYRFQSRERRKEEQNQLVKAFEEDRRRVEEMKERRGQFKPES